MVARHLILPVLAVCLAQGTCTGLNIYINPFIASCELNFTWHVPRADAVDLLSLGVDPREISTYVGVIEGLEALTEVSMIHFVSQRLCALLINSMYLLSSGFHTGGYPS
jgi:hypothetical protein